MNYLLTLLILISTALSAEPLKPFIPAEPTMQGFWWPVYIDASGAQQESFYGLPLGDYPTAADGALLSDIETIIYARALYKPRTPRIKSLGELVEAEKRQFRARNPEVEISAIEPVQAADGETLTSYTYFPRKSGTWERVTYSEEGDFYLLFTIRSQSKLRYQQDLESYLTYIRKYRKPLVNSVRQISDRREVLKRRGEERRSGLQTQPATGLDDLRLN